MKTLFAVLMVVALAGCANATSFSFGGGCHNPKMPKAGQDMTAYAEYLLHHIKHQCN